MRKTDRAATLREFGLDAADVAAWQGSGLPDDAFDDWLTDRVARRPTGLMVDATISCVWLRDLDALGRSRAATGARGRQSGHVRFTSVRPHRCLGIGEATRPRPRTPSPRPRDDDPVASTI
jgi:hypothetical protein